MKLQSFAAGVATTMQIFGMVVLQSLVLGAIALAISSPLALVVARVIGNTRSFLDFSAGADLRIGLTPATLQTGLVAVAVSPDCTGRPCNFRSQAHDRILQIRTSQIVAPSLVAASLY